MYQINFLEFFKCIAKLVSKPKVPLRQQCVPQDEQFYTTIISCKWPLREQHKITKHINNKRINTEVTR